MREHREMEGRCRKGVVEKGGQKRRLGGKRRRER